MGTIQSISWYHNYPPLFVTVLYIAIPMGLGFVHQKPGCLNLIRDWNSKLAFTLGMIPMMRLPILEILTMNEVSIGWSFLFCANASRSSVMKHRLKGPLAFGCLLTPIRRTGKWLSIMDLELGNVGVSLVCFFVVFLVFVIWLASVFGLVFLWMKLMKDFCGIISEPSKRVVKLLFCSVLPYQSVTENLVRYCDWPKNHYIAMLVYPSGVF